MCVRYTLHQFDAALARIAQALAVKLAAPDWVKPRFNIGIAQVAPVVALKSGEPAVAAMMWGLVRDSRGEGNRSKLLPNAKAETVNQLPTFRNSAKKRRCLVPANGFFEWKSAGAVKLPHLFTLSDGEPFAFAGVWDEAAGDLPETFCILTTAPNKLVAPIHNRMPVLLAGDSLGKWMGSEPIGQAEFEEIIRPFPAEKMSVRPVSRYVSNGRNEGPDCIGPPEPETGELALG